MTRILMVTAEITIVCLISLPVTLIALPTVMAMLKQEMADEVKFNDYCKDSIAENESNQAQIMNQNMQHSPNDHNMSRSSSNNLD